MKFIKYMVVLILLISCSDHSNQNNYLTEYKVNTRYNKYYNDRIPTVTFDPVSLTLRDLNNTAKCQLVSFNGHNQMETTVNSNGKFILMYGDYESSTHTESNIIFKVLVQVADGTIFPLTLRENQVKLRFTSGKPYILVNRVKFTLENDQDYSICDYTEITNRFSSYNYYLVKSNRSSVFIKISDTNINCKYIICIPKNSIEYHNKINI